MDVSLGCCRVSLKVVEWRVMRVDSRSGKCGFMFFFTFASAGCGDGYLAVFDQKTQRGQGIIIFKLIVQHQ